MNIISISICSFCKLILYVVIIAKADDIGAGETNCVFNIYIFRTNKNSYIL